MVVDISLPSASTANLAKLTARQIAAEGLPALMQILHLGAVVGGFVESQLVEIVVAQGQAEAVAEGFEVVDLQLLLAVRGHLALAGGTHAVALHGLGEDHRRLAAMRHGACIGGAKFDGVVAAAFEAIDIAVGHVCDQRRQLRVLPKKAFAVIGAVIGREGLELAIDGFGKGTLQHAGDVAREQHIPVRAP